MKAEIRYNPTSGDKWHLYVNGVFWSAYATQAAANQALRQYIADRGADAGSVCL